MSGGKETKRYVIEKSARVIQAVREAFAPLVYACYRECSVLVGQNDPILRKPENFETSDYLIS